jgi:hypothetical protein
VSGDPDDDHGYEMLADDVWTGEQERPHWWPHSRICQNASTQVAETNCEVCAKSVSGSAMVRDNWSVLS